MELVSPHTVAAPDVMPDEVWFGFYLWLVRHSTPKGPIHDHGFTGQSFLQTYTKKSGSRPMELQWKCAIVPEDVTGDQSAVR